LNNEAVKIERQDTFSLASLQEKRKSCVAVKQEKKSVVALYLYRLIIQLINDLIGK